MNKLESLTLLVTKTVGINHGEMSIKVLFENNLIRKFIPNNKYDEIIKTAVINHNRAHIEDGLDKKSLLFSQIIRDADKIDILKTITLPETDLKGIFWYEDFDIAKINENLIEDLKTIKYIYYSKIQNNADQILIFYGYIFNFNFPTSLEIISRNKYLDLFTKRLYTQFKSKQIHTQLEEILQICNDYIGTQNPCKI